MKNIYCIISNPLDAMVCHPAFRMTLRALLRDHTDDLDNDQEKAEAEEKPHVYFFKQEQRKEEGMSFMDLLRKLNGDDSPDTVSEDADEDDEDDDDGALPTDVNSFLRKYRHSECRNYIPKPHIVCADGYRVTIQAGHSKVVHCWPMEDVDEFSHVEVAQPTEIDKELLPYRFETDDPKETLFHFVPVPVMDKVLKKHGGITAVGNEDKIFTLMDQTLF